MMRRRLTSCATSAAAPALGLALQNSNTGAVVRWFSSSASSDAAPSTGSIAKRLYPSNSALKTQTAAGLLANFPFTLQSGKTEGGDGKGGSSKKEGEVKPAPEKPATPAAVNAKKKDTKKGKSDDDDDDDDDDKEGPALMQKAFWGVLKIAALSGVLYYFARPSGTHITWEELELHADGIVEAQIYDRYIQFYGTDMGKGRTAVHVGVNRDERRTDDKLRAINSKRSKPFNVTYVGYGYCESGLYALGIFAWAVPFLFFPTFAMVLMRGMSSLMSTQAAGMEKTGSKLTKAKAFKVARKTDVMFTEVAGLHEAKHEIQEVVDFLKNPEPFKRLGAKIPTGALLLGPPGTGKTLLAKAVAGEADVSFIATTGSDFVELYVGMGALRVRQLFELARGENAKGHTCIIYIDEIDAIGLKRRGAGHGEKQEAEHTLNELLTQMDGFQANEGRILILASSNVAQEQLDPALIRPGRFDRIVHVDSPVIAERKEIFGVHLNKLKLQPDEADEAAFAKAADAKEESTPTEESEKKDAVTEEGTEEKAASVKSTSGDADAAERSKPEETTNKPATTAATAEVVKEGEKTAEATDDASKVEATSESEETSTSEGDEASEQKRKELAEKRAEEKAKLVADFGARMSDLCPGFVGADISNVCNEAAILAARENDTHVTIHHLERSIDRVLAGIEMRSRVLSDFEKKVVAHHEAGHAIAGWYLHRADPLMKVSIVPRGGKALGYAQYLPSENNLRSSNDIIDSMCVTLGGRVAEMIYFNHLSTGASDDLMKVTRMAYQHVTSFGQSAAAHIPPGVHSTPHVKPFGGALSDKFDVAAKKLVDQAYQRTYDLLLSRKAEMTKLAEHLLVHETLTQKDVIDYLGERPKGPSDFKVV